MHRPQSLKKARVINMDSIRLIIQELSAPVGAAMAAPLNSGDTQFLQSHGADALASRASLRQMRTPRSDVKATGVGKMCGWGN